MESTVAIINLGGKQHLVSEGAHVVVNRLAAKEGEVLDLPDLLSDRVVETKVLSHQLGKKINGLKFKAKTRSFKRYGHRQFETTVEVVSIGQAVKPAKTALTKKIVSKIVPKEEASALKTRIVADGQA